MNTQPLEKFISTNKRANRSYQVVKNYLEALKSIGFGDYALFVIDHSAGGSADNKFVTENDLLSQYEIKDEALEFVFTFGDIEAGRGQNASYSIDGFEKDGWQEILRVWRDSFGPETTFGARLLTLRPVQEAITNKVKEAIGPKKDKK